MCYVCLVLILTAFIPENCWTTCNMQIMNIGIRSSAAVKNSFSDICFLDSSAILQKEMNLLNFRHIGHSEALLLVKDH